MLRYAVISRLGFGGRSRLVRTTPLDNRLRPAIAVVGTSLRLIALHAASISSSNTVQLGQLVHAHDEFRKSGAVADLLIGDFNIDLAMHRAYVGGKLKGTSLEHFSPRCSRQGTHRSSGRQHESILDWVLVKPALQGQISIRAIQGTKRTQEEKKQDRYLKLEFENRKNSDHRPIMASW